MLSNFNRSRDNKFLHKRIPSKVNTQNTMTSDEEYMETDRK